MQARAQLALIGATRVTSNGIPGQRRPEESTTPTINGRALGAFVRLQRAIFKSETLPACRENPGDAWDAWPASESDTESDEYEKAPTTARRVYASTQKCKSCPLIYLCTEYAESDKAAAGVLAGTYYNPLNRVKEFNTRQVLKALEAQGGKPKSRRRRKSVTR